MFLGFDEQNDDQSPEDNYQLTHELVKGHNLFAELTEEEIERVMPALRLKKFHNREITCHCPDAHHDAFLVVEGTVALSLSTDDGLQHVLELAGFGTMFNVGGLLGFVEPHKSARALGTVRLLALDTEMLGHVLEDDKHIGYSVLKTLMGLHVAQCDRQLDHAVSRDGEITAV